MTTWHSAAESAQPRDSIDRHIARWGREVPGLVPELEGSVTRMQKLVRHLQQKKEAALARHGLKLWEYEILWRLRSAGEPNGVPSPTQHVKLDRHGAELLF